MAPRAHAHALNADYSLHSRMLGHQLIFVLFMVAQVLDGIFTYTGVSTFGIGAEGNPILAWLMASYGEVIALAGAKLVAAGCGVALYALAVDRLLAVLTLVYIGAALIPWTMVLF